jgi:carbon monoxide dehydrogenase subunit G
MKISGGATMHAPAGRVWAALTDPAVLVATIPGCEQFEPAGQDTYRFTVAAGIASIQASYTGMVSLSQQQEPSSFVLTASGAGAPGSVTTCVQIRLADIADGTTELSYDADAVIGGLIASVGQRMLSSVAKRLVDAFFSSVDKVLAGTGYASPVLADALPPGTAAAATVPVGPVLATTGAGSQAASAAEPGPVPDPGRARLGGPGRSALDAGFTRGMLAGAAVTLAGVAAAGLIRRRAR